MKRGGRQGEKTEANVNESHTKHVDNPEINDNVGNKYATDLESDAISHLHKDNCLELEHEGVSKLQYKMCATALRPIKTDYRRKIKGGETDK